MNDDRRRDPAPRPYTGDTVVMPRAKPQRPQPEDPAQPPRVPPRGPRGPQLSPRPSRRARSRRRLWPTVRNVLLGFIVVLAVLIIAGYWQLNSLASAVVVRDVRPPAFAFGGTNMLIIGTDERVGFPGEGVRGDTLLVAHYDTFGRWVNLLSIPRDTQVGLLDLGQTKVNIAYGQGYARAEELYAADASPQQGGMALAAQTVEQLLQLNKRNQRIDYVATINFDGFARIIDALGGVTIDVPRYILDTEYPTADFGVQTVEFQPGVQRMNGERALIYARTRHDSSDFDRGARQQQVMRAIVDEAKQKGPVGLAFAMPQLREGLQGAVATTMPFNRPDQTLSLLWLASGVDPGQIGQARLSPEIDPSYQEIGSNLVWSEAGISAAVDALLTRPSPAVPTEEKATVQVLNGTAVSGLATQISFQLEDAGFTVTPPGNAADATASETTVYDVTNKPRTARAIAQTLGARYQQGPPEGVPTSTDIVVVVGQDRAK